MKIHTYQPFYYPGPQQGYMMTPGYPMPGMAPNYQIPQGMAPRYMQQGSSFSSCEVESGMVRIFFIFDVHKNNSTKTNFNLYFSLK